ncbi:NADH dehydrogenase [ubiquinone] 1 alpha subcomplex subunit 1 [Ischnura elegans]|uniref:NADH dehydrogenase [ubiquinone] 1 alpha subcomplex subunit 1 n=1 Tax=Ischnura elegans TaxID=197161 RepID=UPI001ED86675|nr:NADH dehydrogenase [ubiquinone] 1 alpha subcomplex subunit 1 [Ischnura elegans]
MWFEIIPAFSIVAVCLAIPHVAVFGLNKLVNGNAFRRDTVERYDRIFYQRDWRITGNPYQPTGLDAIPNEE